MEPFTAVCDTYFCCVSIQEFSTVLSEKKIRPWMLEKAPENDKSMPIVQLDTDSERMDRESLGKTKH